ncbi:DNA-directed RNA polymerase subunit alpha [Mycoplasma nasistruthionis]
MKKLVYYEKPEWKDSNDNVTTLSLKGLERGFGNTVAVALRRVLISSITSLAPFCVKIEGADHEYQSLKGVTEDVTKLILNLRKVKFSYDPSYVGDDDIVKAVLDTRDLITEYEKPDSERDGVVTSKLIRIENNPSVKVINTDVEIATITEPGDLRIEIFLKPGRGFKTFEENKELVAKSKSLLWSDIKKGEYIAVDSDFSPIKKVAYEVSEMHSSSSNNKFEEELSFRIETNGTVSAKNAVSQASEILIGIFKVVGNVDEMKVDIFEEEKVQEEQKPDDDKTLEELNLSVRSTNVLKKLGATRLSLISQLKLSDLEQTKNLGKKSIQEIEEKLREYGYQLKQGDE